MSQPTHRVVETNGIRTHLVEQGRGLVERCHPHVTFYTADGGLSDYDESSKALRLEMEAYLAALDAKEKT